jgi:hypothetical protein
MIFSKNGHKKTPDMPEFFLQPFCGLALGELEAFAGAGLTGLFTLFHAAVTGEAAVGFEQVAVFAVGFNQSAGNAVAQGTGLTGDTAAVEAGVNIELVFGVHKFEGLLDVAAERFVREIHGEFFAVDEQFAHTGGEADAGNRGFAAAGGDKFSGSSGHGEWIP